MRVCPGVVRSRKHGKLRRVARDVTPHVALHVPLFVALVLAIATCGIVAAQPGGAAPPEARALYRSGAYAEAWETAHASEVPAAQLLAAEAAIAQALYVAPEEELREWLARAGTAADRALADADALPTAELRRALLAKAQVRGEVARRSSVLANLDVAESVRELLERALAADPEAPEAEMALGMWHVEVAARGVGWLYGASGREGLERVERAVATAPERIDFRIEYATALHLRDRTPDALTQLGEALALPARNPWDRHQHRRARALQEAWE